MISKGKQVGKGTFSRVYCDTANPNKVWIFTDDKAKEAIAEGIVYSKMLPQLENYGSASDTDDRVVYRADRYDKVRAPKQMLSKKAYRQYTMLRKAYSRISYVRNNYDSYSAVYEAFESIPDEELREDMQEILSGFSNYGSDISFEISPRNIAASDDKSLVLLDCFFFRNDLDAKRRNN